MQNREKQGISLDNNTIFVSLYNKCFANYMTLCCFINTFCDYLNN